MRRLTTLDNDGSIPLFKKVRDREKPRQRIVSEKPRKATTIILEEDSKVTSSLQPSQRIFIRQNAKLANGEENGGRNTSNREQSRNADLHVGPGMLSENDLHN